MLKYIKMKREKITIDGKEYNLFIYFEERNNSRASIGRTGIHLRVPSGMPREELFKETLRLKRWAMEKIKEKPPEFKRKGSRNYKDGDKIQIANEEYAIRLEFKEKQSSSVRIKGNELFFTISCNLPEEKQRKHISVLASRIIGARKLPYIAQKIHELNAKHFDVPIKKIFLKYNQSNWGSCSHQGNINISTRVLFAPDEVIDSVCIHELAHRKEQNHSEEFWNLVEKAMPDYKEKEKWLKENSDKCWF